MTDKKDKEVYYNFRIPLSLREEFKKVADENLDTPSKLMRYWIEEYIKTNKKS